MLSTYLARLQSLWAEVSPPEAFSVEVLPRKFSFPCRYICAIRMPGARDSDHCIRAAVLLTLSVQGRGSSHAQPFGEISPCCFSA